MRTDIKQIQNDFLSSVELQRQSKAHNDPEREYIVRVLALLAAQFN